MNIVAALTLAATSLCQAAPTEKQIGEWIDQLRADGVAERDAAQSKLIQAGEAVLPHLEKAEKDADADLKGRIQKIRNAIRGLNVPAAVERCVKAVADGEKRDKKWQTKLDDDVTALLAKLGDAGVAREAPVKAASLKVSERPEWKPVYGRDECCLATVEATAIERCVVVCAGDLRATTIDRCIVVCGGDIQVTGIEKSIVLVQGGVSATTIKKSVLVTLKSFRCTQGTDSEVYAAEEIGGNPEGIAKLTRLFGQDEEPRGGLKVLRVKDVVFRK